jgi:hypothetical protein
MKSNDFNVNEGLFTGLFSNSNGAADPKQHKVFVNNFVQQFNRDRRIHPNITVDDFIEMYWKKNNWDISNLPPAYQQSLDNTKQAVTTNPSLQAVQQLASVVYNIALKLPFGTRTSNQSSQTQTQPAPTSASAQLDPETIQILGKIRGMKNSPENIIDLTDIISMSLMKLQRISPKSYATVITSLMSNGGNASVPSAATVQKTATPKPMSAGGGKLDPSNPNDAGLISAIQRAQAAGR